MKTQRFFFGINVKFIYKCLYISSDINQDEADHFMENNSAKKILTAPVLAGKIYISLICHHLVPMRIFAPCKRSVN